MNVGEVERLLGMTRANIRFYEKEGLLSPARSENAYRDYSEEDIRALEKIKLLRQLHVDLDAIRRIQQGEESLSAAVAEQVARLRGEQADLAWAERVCQDLARAGVDYAALDARPYLERLDRPADKPGYFALEQDRLETVGRPWRRFFARLLDLQIYSLLWMAFHLLVLRWNPPSNLLINLLNSYVGLGLMMVLEPMLLSTWGYTPGKWLMGLSVRDREGGKLTFAAALARVIGVFGRGLGYGVPIYNLVRLWKSDQACLRGEPLEWEEGRYRLKDEKHWRTAAMLGAAATELFWVFLVAAQALMPICRGDLTAAEYARNINDAARINHLMEYKRMDETGRWIDETPSNTFVMDFFDEGMPDHRLAVTDGVVTGVRLEVELTDPEFMVSPATAQKQLAAIALVAAQPSYHCFSWPLSGVLKAIAEGGMEDYTITAGGMTITNQVEYRGMEGNNEMLFVMEGEQAYYRMVFTIEKAP